MSNRYPGDPLTTDELRAACEAAGLRSMPGRGGINWLSPDEAWMLPEEHPALPTYVASLLVARVLRIDGRDVAAYSYWLAKMHPPALHLATDAQRIRAAMKVLEGEG